MVTVCQIVRIVRCFNDCFDVINPITGNADWVAIIISNCETRRIFWIAITIHVLNASSRGTRDILKHLLIITEYG